MVTFYSLFYELFIPYYKIKKIYKYNYIYI